MQIKKIPRRRENGTGLWGKMNIQVIFAIQRFACIQVQISTPVQIMRTTDNSCKPQKRNQTLKTGTPHENNPMAEKPHPYGAKRNAGYERYRHRRHGEKRPQI
ncbi:hypothetical protein DOM01_28215, partial [Salmonella enterica subsp. enterica serovar Derby]